jgi:phenylacetate-CoA ligase
MMTETEKEYRKYLIEFYKDTFHLHHWTMSPDCINYWELLENTQWESMEQIKQKQLEKLNQLLKYSYKHVPYYKEKFDEHGVVVNNIASFKDLESLPVLGKETIKNSGNGYMLSDKINLEKVLKIRTSGSTGMPLHIYADADQLDWRYAAVLRYWGWTGWEFGDKSIRLWHQKIGMNELEIKKERIDSYLLGRRYIPVFEMNDKNLMKYILDIIEYKPKMMDGYAEAFEIIADYIKHNNLQDVFVPSIISSAQMLSDKMRAKIEQSLHSEVFDRYGCREFSTVAHECPVHKGYHITAENLIVEILKDGKSVKEGEMGEIVITDLNNYSQPMIRYRIGDLAIKINEKCSCGRGLPLIGKITGRTKGVIQGTNGMFLTTAYFLHYLKDFEEEIRQFQVVQESLDKIKVFIIPERKTGITTKTKETIAINFKEKLGQDMNIDFCITETIEMVKTGKHQAVISNIPFNL